MSQALRPSQCPSQAGSQDSSQLSCEPTPEGSREHSSQRPWEHSSQSTSEHSSESPCATQASSFAEQVRERFGRRAADYERHARLQQATAWRLAHHCRALALPEGPCADLGAGSGLLSRALIQHHPQLIHRAPLQLDQCPELLARNPLSRCDPGQPDPHRPDLHPDGADKTPCGNSAGGAGPAASGNARGRVQRSLSGAGDPGCAGGDPLLCAPGNSALGGGSLIWDLNAGLPASLQGAALLASSFALQWLDHPARELRRWCRHLAPGGALVLAVPTNGSFPQWHLAAARSGIPCTALCLPEASELIDTARQSGLQILRCQRLRFSRPGQGGLETLRHLRQLGASASRRAPLSAGQLRRLLQHWPAASPLTWEVLLLIARRPV